MFNINENCRLEQFVAKKNFYTYADMTGADKKIFTDDISKITLLYQLQPRNTNIAPYKDDIREYPMINVFEIQLSQDGKLKRIAEIIMRSIPYPTVLVFSFDDKYQIWTAHQRTNQNDETKNVLEDFINTDWETDIDWLDISQMNMTNFYALYSDIVDCISVHNAKAVVQSETELTGDEARAITTQLAELDNQIIALKASMKKETQFNKRVELNMQIKKLEQKKKIIVGC
ncbi:MAG: DUF4391 domain-containing protein [Clostridia bacterium]|nr:DUF4391 domain-containing protein [Clostridia bacterium]